MTPLYTATAHATGDGRNGHTRSDDGILDLDVRIPKEMGGAGGATNPEQLFAAGYAACFHSALKFVAGQDKLDVTDTEVSASVGIGSDPERRVRAGGRARRPRAEPRPGDGRGAGREGAPGVPVLERDTRQHRGEAHRRVTCWRRDVALECRLDRSGFGSKYCLTWLCRRARCGDGLSGRCADAIARTWATWAGGHRRPGGGQVPRRVQGVPRRHASGRRRQLRRRRR